MKDCSSIPNFVPIGATTNGSFQGHFDGQNYAVIGLNIDFTGNVQVIPVSVGLFSWIENAEVKNVFFLNCVVKTQGSKCNSITATSLSCPIGILTGSHILFFSREIQNFVLLSI